MGQKHTISCLVENHFGVLCRVAGLISARGFNIDSLTVGETEDATVSRMTIVVDADERTLEQVKKQLNRLIDVIKVQELKDGEFIDRELVLIKVTATPAKRGEVIQIAETFQSKVVDVNTKTVTVECSGDQGKIHAFLEVMKPFGIKEVVRTGRIALARGTAKEVAKEETSS
ncbi:MAG: acetolactate synthase small subunit [Candidatus Omnitrophica bacterium]|nr:acetolactate synthase small subunit [Candidatus Omnitrophota bacterium]